MLFPNMQIRLYLIKNAYITAVK